ncbi:MAG: hypothetical protein HY876_01895, partial [Coriobacteriales bacterium]|nr:hypothetical protein [Coriobacteriales bacterium]
VAAVVKVPEPREAGTLVTRAVARVDVPSAGYEGGSTRRSVDAARQLRLGEAARAEAILSGLIVDHPILGKHGRWGRTRVTVGATPGGEQAVAYYASGRIVVDPRHAASLERIVTHEAWHVIDYRDNGRIDWGEQVPPR